MPRNRKMLMLAALVVVTAASVFVSAGPALATVNAQPSLAKHCVVVVRRAASGSSMTLVERSSCSADQVKSVVNSPSDTQLAEFHGDINYGGSEVGLFADGPCDQVGYDFGDTTIYNGLIGGISSYQVFNNCGTTDIYHDTNESGFCGTHEGSVSYVGNACNDHLYSIFLRS